MCNLKFQRGSRFRTFSMRSSSMRIFRAGRFIRQSLLFKLSSSIFLSISSSSSWLVLSCSISSCAISSSTKISWPLIKLFRMIDPLSTKIWIRYLPCNICSNIIHYTSRIADANKNFCLCDISGILSSRDDCVPHLGDKLFHTHCKYIYRNFTWLKFKIIMSSNMLDIFYRLL